MGLLQKLFLGKNFKNLSSPLFQGSIDHMSNKALFLDRDGVINIDHGYVYKINDFDFVSGIFALSRKAIQKGYKIFVVTNQAGIARGLYSLQDFNSLTDWMCERFEQEQCEISKVYFSPYHPTEGIGKYRKNDFSRKPNPGMIFSAQKEFDINLKCSILIGDKASDIEAGISAGVGTNLRFREGSSPTKGVISRLDQAFDYLR
jgi:D-glycero-D-manno-heptose 1,7-bisphosphate phosphatase